MSKENIKRSVPESPHPDMEGRVSYVYMTYPKPAGPRLAESLQSTKGYIRGADAEVKYNALRPYLDQRQRQNSADVRVERSGIETASFKFEK